MTVPLLLGAVVGLLLGLLGGGGSMIAVPLLTHGIGVENAVPAALLAVSLASLGAALPHAQAGGVDLKTAVPFLLIGSVASAAGARISLETGEAPKQLLFAAVAAAAGIRLLRPATEASPPRRSWGRIIAAAAGAGFLTGFLGVGGGFLLVPALSLAAGLPMRRAVGTSLLILGVTALTGFASHLAMGAALPPAAPAFAAGALLAAIPTAFVSARLPQAGLKRAFAALLLLVSSASVWQAVEKI